MKLRNLLLGSALAGSLAGCGLTGHLNVQPAPEKQICFYNESISDLEQWRNESTREYSIPKDFVISDLEQWRIVSTNYAECLPKAQKGSK